MSVTIVQSTTPTPVNTVMSVTPKRARTFGTKVRTMMTATAPTRPMSVMADESSRSAMPWNRSGTPNEVLSAMRKP